MKDFFKKEKPLQGWTGFGGGATSIRMAGGATKIYLDEVFSTYLHTGTGASNSINNSVDLSGEGGLVWIKQRNTDIEHFLFDTARGALKPIHSDSNWAEYTANNTLTSFNSNGYTLGSSNYVNGTTSSPRNYSGYTFRKAPGFFDIVTWTGDGSNNRQISHSLESVPGMIFVKKTSHSEGWCVYHKEVSSGYYLPLNGDEAQQGNSTIFPNAGWITSTYFTIGTGGAVNQSGHEYIAYVFAGGESTDSGARSVHFDAGDYISLASSSDFTLGTNDFTLETWIYPTSCTQDVGIPDPRSASSNAVQCMFGFNSSLRLFVYVDGSHLISPSASTQMEVNQWQHVAYCRSGTTGRIFINGEQVTSVTDNNNYVQASAAYGWHAYQGATFVGRLSNARIVNGTAVYTSSFIPPTEPLANITNTKLLCCQNSQPAYVTVAPASATAHGTPTVSDSISPFDDPAGFKFGPDGDNDIIKTGKYVGNGSTNGPEVYIGWEPTWLLTKKINGSGNWNLYDSMRGMVTGGGDSLFRPNNTDAESDGVDAYDLTPTGFKVKTNYTHWNDSGYDFMWVAIRRPDGYVGKPPELGTDVFNIVTGTSDSSVPGFVTNNLVDFYLYKSSSYDWGVGARLLSKRYWKANTTAATSSDSDATFDYNNGFGDWTSNLSGFYTWAWTRHAGFDVVTYKGDGVAGRQVPHSMNKTPEMMWVKRRNNTGDWFVYHKGLDGGSNPETHYITVNSSGSEGDSNEIWNDTAPTSTSFTLGIYDQVNGSNQDIIAMLFSSVEGISKVGYYTGNGSATERTITLGFQPRFLILKNASGGNNWFVFDTVRGWASGNDATLSLNSDAAEYSGEDYGEPTSTGFTITSSLANVNENNSTYIYYAHA